MIVLNTNIPCENCANAIRNTLKSIPNITYIDCSVEKSQIQIETSLTADEEGKLRRIIIETLKKTGRIAS